VGEGNLITLIYSSKMPGKPANAGGPRAVTRALIMILAARGATAIFGLMTCIVSYIPFTATAKIINTRKENGRSCSV